MNTNDTNLLIEENEIRAALSFTHIDRDAFGRGVRQRVTQREQDIVERPANPYVANLNDRGNLLRIAASVLPVNLFGVKTTGSTTSLAAMGNFQKAIALSALPAISFLMIVVTIVSWLKIRGAQQSQSLPAADLAQVQESLSGWWKRYRWIAATVFVLTLVTPFFGWTSPLLFLIIGSAIATASMVTTLGRAGLVDRNVIGGYCIAMLGLLGQVSSSVAISNNTQLLDPHLVPVTFYVGIAILIFFVNPFGTSSSFATEERVSKQTILLIVAGNLALFAWVVLQFSPPLHLLIAAALLVIALVALLCWSAWPWRIPRIGFRSFGLVLILGLTAFFGQTLWRPVGTSTLVQYAETFEPHLAGQWSYWQVTARWLQDQDIDFDHSAVQTRWLDSMNKDQTSRALQLKNGIGTGLTLPPELIETEEFKSEKQRLLSSDSANTRIFGLAFDEYIIVELAEKGALTNEQKDHLARRLMATWRAIHGNRLQHPLEPTTTITNLLSLIDRPLAQAERRDDVIRWLGEFQVLENLQFSRSGGFKSFSTSTGCDLLSTERAVRLMQQYGINGTHDINGGVDILALRAFLRPRSSDQQLIDQGSVRTAARQRLDQIPGIIEPSLWDYIRLNQSLWFAMLLVGLCVYTTLGSPQILENPRPTTDATLTTGANS